MNAQIFPWRTQRNIEDTLADARDVLAALGIVEPTGGCTDAEIADAEKRMRRPLPDDVREFYCKMRPTPLFADNTNKEFGFFTIGSDELIWRSMEGAEPPELWVGANGLALGQSLFGDPFWWVEGHRFLPDGSIILLDHEGTIGEDVMFVHFARSYREFLSKLTYFKGLYPYPENSLFRLEYEELNRQGK
jgi:hypothetical protein